MTVERQIDMCDVQIKSVRHLHLLLLKSHFLSFSVMLMKAMSSKEVMSLSAAACSGVLWLSGYGLANRDETWKEFLLEEWLVSP